jgi:hypothetical protein
MITLHWIFTGLIIALGDSSPESTSRIHLVFDKGKLKSQAPASTVFFLGGGCGVINFFRSEEALDQWLVRYPELKDKPQCCWSLRHPRRLSPNEKEPPPRV